MVENCGKGAENTHALIYYINFFLVYSDMQCEFLSFILKVK